MQTTFVVQQVTVLAILMAVGYIATKKNIITEEISKGITDILTNIALPALILSSFNFGYSKDTLSGILLIFVYSIVTHLVVMLISKIVFIKYPKEKNVILRFGTIFPNSGFMGIPLIYELLGQEAVLYTSIFMIPYHTIQWTYGDGMLTKEKSGSALKKLVTNPAVIAVFIGVTIFILNIQVPYIISKPISLFSGLTSPLSMLLLGERITRLKLKDIVSDKNIYYGCFIKLILVPLVTLLLLKVVNAPELFTNIVVIMQSLPAAVLLVILTQKHDGDIDFASRFTIVSHMLSIITIPIISIFL